MKEKIQTVIITLAVATLMFDFLLLISWGLLALKGIR